MQSAKLLLLASLLSAGVAYAQAVDVPALTKLIDTQPSSEDRSAWKEKRRDAARKLGQSKDKRAVPVLIQLAETETFDIIGDIAIEGLGNLGDPSAMPVLRKIIADQTRDKATREIAKKALAKLPDQASTPALNTPTIEPTPAPEPVPEPVESTTGGDLLGNAPKTTLELPPGPALPEDVLAASDRLTIAAGTAALQYDTLRKRPSFDADVAGRYEKRIEREAMAWGVDAGAHVVGGFVNPEGQATTKGLQVTVDGGGEVRFYRGQIYGVGKAAAGAQLTYVSMTNDDTTNPQTIKDARTTADFQVAIGGGYGRLLDVGGAIRVRRLARTLDAARVLGKQIDAATAKRLQLAWWSLRGERSTYEALVATVAILREAGMLLGEPDAGLAYEIANVLRDTQLYKRPSGLDVQLAIGEGYLYRPDSDDDQTFNERGRVEQLLLSAGYGQQLADDKAEVSGTAFARLRLFADDTGDNAQPSPWGVGVTGRLRRFAYGEHGDALGALDLSATLLLSSDSCIGMDCDSTTGKRIQGEVGFTFFMNQASGLRVAGNIAQDGGELFLGATLTASYGFLAGSFAGL